ncbi:hypothetical protein [uncultured Prevotella sp.]|nr:hypothetical protein [uncultured Prevotella sp.]
MERKMMPRLPRKLLALAVWPMQKKASLLKKTTLSSALVETVTIRRWMLSPAMMQTIRTEAMNSPLKQNGTDESDDTDNESAFDKFKAKMEKLLEDTDTFMSNPMTDQELYTAMIMRDPKLKWHMVKNEL